MGSMGPMGPMGPVGPMGPEGPMGPMGTVGTMGPRVGRGWILKYLSGWLLVGTADLGGHSFLGQQSLVSILGKNPKATTASCQKDYQVKSSKTIQASQKG